MGRQPAPDHLRFSRNSSAAARHGGSGRRSAERRRAAAAHQGNRRHHLHQETVSGHMRSFSVIAISTIVAGTVLVSPAFCQKARTSRAVVVSRSGNYLGVGAIDIDEERAKALNLKEARGVEIKSVDADSPAAKAGLKEGDVVLDYNGTPVVGFEQFARLVRETPAGRQVRISVWRGGTT